MNLKLSFSWVGLVVFALPMLINIAYAVFPPGRKGRTGCGGFALDRNRGADQPDRLFGGDYTFGEPRANSIPKCLALACCLVPHIVLCRMDTVFCRRAGDRLANRAFLFIPMPLAVFPVIYFLCAAVWLHNLPAVILMTIFGAAHLTVSIQSFR